MGTVELFELCETDLETQCKECLLDWSQGIVHCICGHFLKESEVNRGAIQCSLDLFSIQNYVIKKGRPHGHRFGKIPEQGDWHLAHDVRKRCIKRRCQGIHDRFLKDTEFRESQLEHDRIEEVCIQMDEFEQKDFSYHMTQAVFFFFDPGRKGEPLSMILEYQTIERSFWTVCTKNLEHDNSGQFHFGNTSNGTHHRVLLPKVVLSWWSFLRVHSKSTKKGACKGLRSNGATRWKQIFDENLRRIYFKNSFYFVTDRPFTVDCCLLQQTGITATRTPSTTRSTTRNPIMCAAIWNTWGTRECALCCSLRSQSLFCCRHTHPLHIALWLKMFAFASHSIPWS